MVPSQTDFIVPTTDEVAKAHVVDSLLRTPPDVLDVDGLPQPPGGCSVHYRPH